MPDRGQTELLGFALVFAIIILALTLITATGFAGLYGAQSHQQTVNIQSAFELIDSNLDTVVDQGAPSRSTEVKLAAGSLHVDESLLVHIDAGTTSRTIATGALVYTSDGDTRIVYESGMLVRADGDRAIGFGSPSSHADAGTVFRIIALESVGSDAVGGTTTVLVHATAVHTEVIDPVPNATTTIEFESAYPAVWHDHLSDVAAASPECAIIAETTIECQPGHGHVVIDTVAVSFR